uniref:Ig-like domain-containing protein n=1 Tax=Astyanax mexicanus TaxID=7994 RepID=A0A8B9HZQ9_ASTMX
MPLHALVTLPLSTDMFILVCRYNRVFAYPGDDVTLTSHLSPETSAVDMEIRWFRGIECIYLYKNGQVTVGKRYEGRLSLFTEELKIGNVSLLLRDVGQADTGIYSCQVISGGNWENRVEKTIHLYMAGTEILSPERSGLKIAEQDSLDMEESVHSLEIKKRLQKKDKELQDKIKELESMAVELRRVTGLLQDRETGLDGMRKVVNDREVRLNSMASELEAFKRELEKLALKLQEKEEESKVLSEELQARTRAVQELTVNLQEKEQELEEEKKHQEEREQELEEEKQHQEEREQLPQTVNGGSPSMADVPQSPPTSELVEASEKMLSKMYQDPTEQLEEIERWIQQQREERKAREEQERTDALEKEFLRYALMMKEQIEEEHEKIMTVVKMAADLKMELEYAETEEERGELELQLKEASERQRQGEEEMDRLAKEIDRQRNIIEEKHKNELEEIREKYEVVSRIEAETNLLKIILPDVQMYFRNVTAPLRNTWKKQMQELESENIELKQTEERYPYPDSVEDYDREYQRSPIEEEESPREILEVSELRMHADQLSHLSEEGPELSDSYEENQPRLEGEMNEKVQQTNETDSESETSELHPKLNMVNGMMINGGHEEIQTDIGHGAQKEQEGVGEHDEKECEEDLDYAQ